MIRANNIAIWRTIGMTLTFFIGWAFFAGSVSGLFDGCFGPVAHDVRVTYATYAEMEADDAITHGWIPEFVPQSASNIEECHNPERHTSWLRFSAPKRDIDAMTKRFSAIPPNAIVFPTTPPCDTDQWWPESLTRGGSKQEQFDYFVVYGTHAEKQFVAVDSPSETVWHWRP